VSDAVRKTVRLRADLAPEGISAQPPDEVDRWTPDHAIKPPADLEGLAHLTQIARTRRSCIEAMVLNTVGRGFKIVAREGFEEEASDEEIAELERLFDKLARRDRRLIRPSLPRLLSAVKWDEEEVGNGYLEVSRSKLTGEIDGLFHAPGKEVRRRKDQTGWVLGPKDAPASERIEFYDFGDKVKYDGEGKPTGTLKDSGRRWDRNELIPFRIFTSESRDYGLPRDAHLTVDYVGDRNAAESNVSFFGSSGVPPTVIFVKQPLPDSDSEEVELVLDPSIEQKIAQTLSADKGTRHRVAVIKLPEGVEADSIDLATLSERDMGFIEFRKDNRRATHGAFRLSPIFTADIEDTNYSTAETERKLTKEQTFDPDQDRWEDILSDSLLRDMGYPHLKFVLVEIDVTDDKVQGESADALADHEAITNGEYRRAHGQEPMPEADKGKKPKPGEVEFGWNGMLVKVRGNGDPVVQRGAEAAAQLLAEGQKGGGVGIEANPT